MAVPVPFLRGFLGGLSLSAIAALTVIVCRSIRDHDQIVTVAEGQLLIAMRIQHYGKAPVFIEFLICY